MNKRGQALVEFVLILPIIIFLLLAIYDFGMIFNNKNVLIGNTQDIIDLYKSGKSIDEIKQIYEDTNISVVEDGEYKKMTVSTDMKLVTPGFNRVFGNPYTIKVERYLLLDDE